jgi:hypothetical protein
MKSRDWARFCVAMGVLAVWPADGFSQDRQPVVQLPVVREIGERHRLELVKENEKYVNNERKQVVRSRTLIDVEVVRKLAKGFLIRWTFGKTALESAAAIDPWVRDLANRNEGLRLDLRTDASGAVEGLENRDAVVTHGRSIFEALMATIKAKGLPKGVENQLRGAMAPVMNPLSVEAATLSEPKLLYFPSGRSYRLRTAQPYADLLPNPLGGEPFPSQAQFRLASADRGENTAVIDWQQTIDPEKSGPILVRTFEALYKRMGRPVPPEMSLPRVLITDEAQFIFDMRTGWPRTVSSVRTVAIGPQRTVQRLKFRILPRGK